jgi:hypothetical protein
MSNVTAINTNGVQLLRGGFIAKLSVDLTAAKFLPAPPPVLPASAACRAVPAAGARHR